MRHHPDVQSGIPNADRLGLQSRDVRAPPDSVFKNLFDLTLHPKGLVQFMENPEEIVPHTFRRLRSAAASNPAAGAVLKKVERRKALQSFAELHERSESLQASVLIEQYKVGLELISLVSMVASFGSPEDVTTQEIQIELFLPAGEKTKAFFEEAHSYAPV